MSLLARLGSLVPAFMLNGDGRAAFRTFARLYDEYVAWRREGIDARFPRRAVANGTTGALALIGHNRGLIQGRTETDAAFAERLVAWRHPRGHRARGNAYSLLEQVSIYWGRVLVQLIDRKGRLWEWSETGVMWLDRAIPWEWGTSPTSEAGRFWLVLDGSAIMSANTEPEAHLGDPGYTLGQLGAAAEDVAAMRNLLYGRVKWRPGGTQPEWLVVALFDWRAVTARSWDDTFDYTFGDPLQLAPEPSWEHWSKTVDGVRVASRDTRYRYWSLDPAWNNTYKGDETAFATAVQISDGTAYTPDPANFSTSLVSPVTGATLTGDPARFHTALRLLDDGSVL